jgi:hypothetical protein
MVKCARGLLTRITTELAQLSGVAAILRYPLPELEDLEDDEEEQAEDADADESADDNNTTCNAPEIAGDGSDAS